MARQLNSPESLRWFAEQFTVIAKVLEACAGDIEAVEGLEGALIHETTIRTTRIPELLDWVDAVDKDVKSQIRAFKAGVRSRAEKNIARAQLPSSRKAAKSTEPKPKAAKKG